MTRALADRITARRASDRRAPSCNHCRAPLADLIEIHPGIFCCSCRETSIREGLAIPVPPDAPAVGNAPDNMQPDSSLIPEGTAGAPSSDDLDIPEFLRRSK